MFLKRKLVSPMNEYIPEEYNTMIASIQHIIDKYELDPMLIASIIRGSIEIDALPMERASIIYTTPNKKTYSTKPQNIKFNLSFALSNLFRLKSIFTQKELWIILAIIHLIIDLFTCSRVEINETHALILLATYRLQSSTDDRILEYAKDIKPANFNEELDLPSVRKALDFLLNIKCIQMINGKYEVIETITSSLF